MPTNNSWISDTCLNDSRSTQKSQWDKLFQVSCASISGWLLQFAVTDIASVVWVVLQYIHVLSDNTWCPNIDHPLYILCTYNGEHVNKYLNTPPWSVLPTHTAKPSGICIPRIFKSQQLTVLCYQCAVNAQLECGRTGLPSLSCSTQFLEEAVASKSSVQIMIIYTHY